ncbi:hypothetical protein HYW40_01680 [Candidatus Curtissbacteria bacterium]|nr:hypothetical protein [Candidatus Curtissbacteria bacterium]
MSYQKGFAPILIIIAVGIIGLAGAAGAALMGQAPVCPTEGTAARSEKEIGDTLDKSGSVNITDGEATSLAGKYVAGKVQNTRVCFTSGLGHASGNIKLASFSPSFYASAGVDLSGSTPKATNLDIKVGSLPNVPVLSSQAESFVTSLINENLAKFALKKKYSAQFTQGSITISKLSN